MPQAKNRRILKIQFNSIQFFNAYSKFFIRSLKFLGLKTQLNIAVEYLILHWFDLIDCFRHCFRSCKIIVTSDMNFIQDKVILMALSMKINFDYCFIWP